MPLAPASQISEKELVQKVLDGEERYFNDLISRYENQIYQYALRMCGNPADAEDIFQETFLNAFRALDKFRGDSKFSTWLYRIANNSCLMKRRKSKFAPDQELSLEDIVIDKGIEKDFVSNSPTSSPIKNILTDEFREILQEILLELPKKYRQTFILADLQGFRGQEIADILGITVASVKSRLHRARLFLRERLATYLEDEYEL